MTRSFALAASLLLASVTLAAANGAVSEFATGGVIFKAEKNIAIAREDLAIGWDQIHVHYVFASSADQPLERTIGFPLAKVPQDDSPDGVGASGLGNNYQEFSATVNGKPVNTKLHEYGWLDEIDITAKLKQMGVPVYVPTSDDFEKLAALPKATRDRLIADGLVDAESEDGWLIPKWRYQAVYEWSQSFAPGETEVDVTYAPLIGASNSYGDYHPGGADAKGYCIGKELEQRLAAYPGPLAGPAPYTVGYILKTANNWNGPIGEFNLSIIDKDSLSTFCPPHGLSAASADGKDWTAMNFVPSADLAVLFFHLEPGQ